MTESKTQNRAGGRPTMPIEQRRTERISFGVTKAQKAAFLINAAQAGLASNDYARDLLCNHGARVGSGAARAPNFELIDILSRIGADLARLRFIADETGTVPPAFDDVIARLDRKLDNLIVGAGIADELQCHRAKLFEIAEKLDARREMTAKARGMITTFDRVVNKVLSA
jgi:Mobilization protein NikA